MFLRGSLLPQGVTSSSQAWSPWGSSKTQMILNLRGSAIFAFCCKLQLEQSRHQYYWLCIISNWRIKWKWILKIHFILISWLKISKKDGWLPLQRVWKMFWRGNQPCCTPNKNTWQKICYATRKQSTKHQKTKKMQQKIKKNHRIT